MCILTDSVRVVLKYFKVQNNSRFSWGEIGWNKIACYSLRVHKAFMSIWAPTLGANAIYIHCDRHTNWKLMFRERMKRSTSSALQGRQPGVIMVTMKLILMLRRYSGTSSLEEWPLQPILEDSVLDQLVSMGYDTL